MLSGECTFQFLLWIFLFGPSCRKDHTFVCAQCILLKWYQWVESAKDKSLLINDKTFFLQREQHGTIWWWWYSSRTRFPPRSPVLNRGISSQSGLQSLICSILRIPPKFVPPNEDFYNKVVYFFTKKPGYSILLNLDSCNFSFLLNVLFKYYEAFPDYLFQSPMFFFSIASRLKILKMSRKLNEISLCTYFSF